MSSSGYLTRLSLALESVAVSHSDDEDVAKAIIRILLELVNCKPCYVSKDGFCSSPVAVRALISCLEGNFAIGALTCVLHLSA